MNDDYVPEHRAEHEEDPLIGEAPPKADVLFSNSVYNKLKILTQIWLPAAAVFYISVAPLWGLPKQEEVSGTIMALTLFLGAALGFSSRQYKNSDSRFDGQILITPDDENDASDLHLSVNAESVINKDEVSLKINRS